VNDAQLEAEVQQLREIVLELIDCVSNGGVQKMDAVGLARAKFINDEVGREAARLTPLVKAAEQRQQKKSRGLGLFKF
jgi:hypothetical protein